MTGSAAVVITEEGGVSSRCDEPAPMGVCAKAPEGAPCACAGMTLYVRPPKTSSWSGMWRFRVRPDATVCPLWTLGSVPTLIG